MTQQEVDWLYHYGCEIMRLSTTDPPADSPEAKERIYAAKLHLMTAAAILKRYADPNS